jgi:biopolymer transport protein ExbB
MDTVPDIVDAVLILLVFLSVLIWGVAIAKFMAFRRNRKMDERFLKAFQDVDHVDELWALTETAKGTLARICHAGLNELSSLQRVALSAYDRRAILTSALDKQSVDEKNRMESGLGILASIGSTAPFIGLFGTVWGIMQALKNISATGSAGLDVVAGPIGEALIATAIGIAAAVPAVLAYNYFLRKVKRSMAAMNVFAASFQNLVLKSGL